MMVGATVGYSVGGSEGGSVAGSVVGGSVGSVVGASVGLAVGAAVGSVVGSVGTTGSWMQADNSTASANRILKTDISLFIGTASFSASLPAGEIPSGHSTPSRLFRKHIR